MLPSANSGLNTPMGRGFWLPSLVCFLFSLTFLPFFCDDALISLRYSQNLLDGYGLVWNPGETVEGYSNLIWVLMVAALGYIGVDLILAARIWAAVLMISVLAANYWYWRKRLKPGQFRYFEIAQYGFALSATTGVWLIGGLEQPVIAAGVAWAAVFLLDYLEQDLPAKEGVIRLLQASLALGIFCLARPDSPLICLCFALAVLVIKGINLKSILACWTLAIFPLLFVGVQLIFRLAYYDQWVANPALIKVNPTLITHAIGLVYVLTGYLFMGPFTYYGFRALQHGRTDPALRPLTVLVGVTLVVWTAYLIFIGGDIFAAYRHFTLIVVLMALSFPAVYGYFRQKSFEPAVPQVTAMVVLYMAMQWFNPATGFARGHLWVWDGQSIAHAMHLGWPDKKPTIAVDAAGSLPYFTGYPAIDMLGLNDKEIPNAEPDLENILYTGHQFGDGAYVLSRKPDLVNFCFPSGQLEPCWKSGKEMIEAPEFQANYRPVRFKVSGNDTKGVQWIRIESPEIGIEKGLQSWHVPAYLFANADLGTTETFLSPVNEFVVKVTSTPLSLNVIPSVNDIAGIRWLPESANLKVDIATDQEGNPELSISSADGTAYNVSSIIIDLAHSDKLSANP